MASGNAPRYTLETIYTAAVEQIIALKLQGNLSQTDFDLITRATKAEDFLDYAKVEMSKNVAFVPERSRLAESMQALLTRIKGFESALDMLAQSSPQILGINIVGLIWGTMKFIMVVARDILDVFEDVWTAMQEIANALPAMSTYISIFGDSELQLLKDPLVNIYTLFVMFGLKTIRLFSRPSLRSVGRSALKSLRSDVQKLMVQTEVARREIDSLAGIEHMHQTNTANKNQALENQRAEEFRQTVKAFLASSPAAAHVPKATEQPKFIDAPTSLLSANFSGRDRELSRLDAFFRNQRVGNDIQRFAIHGMPGVGKTQLSLSYAISNWPNRYSMIFWLPANTVERLNQGFADILRLIGHVDRSHSDQPTRLISARRYLEDCQTDAEKPWLLVIDNVNKDTIGFLRDHLPRTSHGGDILFTTRAENVALGLAQSASPNDCIIPLKPPQASDAARILLKSVDASLSRSPEHFDLALSLVKSVGCLPLAVDQAASFMKERKLALKDLLSLYRTERKAQLIRWQNELSTYEQQSIAAAFDLQLERLERISPGASGLLNVLSFLDYESLPVSMLTNAATALMGVPRLARDQSSESRRPSAGTRRLSLQKIKLKFSRRSSIDSTPNMTEPDETYIESFASPVKFDESVQVLRNLSLIEQQPFRDTVVIRVHDLVQYMVQERSRLQATGRRAFHDAIAMICSAFLAIKEPSSYQKWSQSEIYIPHIQALTKHSDSFGERHPQLVSSNIEIAGYFRARGRYVEAQALFQDVLVRSEKDFGSKDPRTIQAMQDVASIHKSQGRYKEAETLFRRVLHQQTAALGRDSLHALRTAQKLAMVFTELGTYEEAVALSRRTLARVTMVAGHDHVEAIRATQTLASVYEKSGNLEDAEKLYKRALSVRTRFNGPTHPSTQQILHNLAVVYSRQGRFEEAEPFYEKALEWRRNQLGHTHPDTLSTLQNLALVCHELGDPDGALAFGLEALRGRQNQLGPDHLDTLQSAQNLAMLYERQDDFTKSGELYRIALHGFSQQLGSGHPSTLRIMHNFAYCYERQERLPEAKALYRRALTGRRQKLGPSHTDTLRTQNRLRDLCKDDE